MSGTAQQASLIDTCDACARWNAGPCPHITQPSGTALPSQKLVDDLRAEIARLERECDAWEKHGQEETFARERVERDLGIVIDNRNSQMLALTSRLSAKETALQLVMDAVTLTEAKRIAREGIRDV